jgi:hypothetical protein
MKRAKAQVVLEALMMGFEVVLNGDNLVLLGPEETDSQYQLALKAKRYTGLEKEGEDILLRCDWMNLDHFVSACEALTDEYVSLIASNVALALYKMDPIGRTPWGPREGGDKFS